jgi:hypothetical protein
MRATAALGTNGPTSLSTRRRIGDSGLAAIAMAISPPMEVPTQSTWSVPARAISPIMSLT